MPKYYCDYCDVYLTHDSASVRKTHNTGWKHKQAVLQYYKQFAEDWTQALIDSKVREMEATRMAQGGGAPYLPFPPSATGMLPPPYPVPGMMPGMGPPLMPGPPGMGGPPGPNMPPGPPPHMMFPPHHMEGGPPGGFPHFPPFPGGPMPPGMLHGPPGMGPPGAGGPPGMGPPGMGPPGAGGPPGAPVSPPGAAPQKA